MGEEVDANTFLVLGEIRGQLRELVHTSNNNGTKIDAMTARIGAVEMVTSRFESILSAFEQVAARVDALEKVRDQQDGAAGMLNTIMRSPAIGWLVGAAVTAFALVKGWVQIP